MATIIRDTDFKGIANGVKIDARRRVILPDALVREGIIYHIYHNSIGQILLDPQVTIPASELWLFEDKDALASVDKGMLESGGINRGSFAKYVRNAP